jgi:ribosomal protein S12 methylthiotransferase accessory factor
MEANMDIKVTFPGNKKVNAVFNNFEIKTDQPVMSGGDGTAPSPYDLFLASLATCAGIFAISFFQTRGLNAEGFEMNMNVSWDKVKHKLGKVTINAKVPADFPDKYMPALKQAIELCSVKRTIADPPEFETIVDK